MKRITVAFGDGIGPEIMKATLMILEKSGLSLSYDTIEIGEKIYRQGITSGIRPEAWEHLRNNQIFLKAPITTPQGGGFKSLNVTIRKTLGLFANIRPCISYHPFVRTLHPTMDLTIIRENEEDLYAGIEHRQTPDVYQTLKLVSRPGTEKIIRYAFEYARRYQRSKVTCLVKDNIMKMSDGIFHKTFDEIGAEYPEIQKDHWIVDIGAARLATKPELFDVMVMPNLYGDILSDIAAEISGSVGLGGSANVGDKLAMFEAIHGSAPAIAGQNCANPSGLILGAIQMLVHMGEAEVAESIHNAWLKTLEDGVHTPDIGNDVLTKKKVGTQEFALAVCDRLGEKPEKLKVIHYARASQPLKVWVREAPSVNRVLEGFDIFVFDASQKPETLADAVQKALQPLGFRLSMISNRGIKVWPDGFPETFCTDHWRCRLLSNDDSAPPPLWKALEALLKTGVDVIKVENLYCFDGQKGYSLGQGE